jgi:hypothetical protein
MVFAVLGDLLLTPGHNTFANSDAVMAERFVFYKLHSIMAKYILMQTAYVHEIC